MLLEHPPRYQTAEHHRHASRTGEGADFGLAKHDGPDAAMRDEGASDRGLVTSSGRWIHVSQQWRAVREIDARLATFSASQNHPHASDRPIRVRREGRRIPNRAARRAKLRPHPPPQPGDSAWSRPDHLARAMAEDLRLELGESAQCSTPICSDSRSSLTDCKQCARPRTASSTVTSRGLSDLAPIAAAIVAMLLAVWFAPAPSRREPPPEACRLVPCGTSAIREGAYFQASKALSARSRSTTRSPWRARDSLKPTRRLN